MNHGEAVRECNICPTWVIRCAHFGDVTVYLADLGLVPACICDPSRGNQYFALQVVRGERHPCIFRPCTEMALWSDQGISMSGHTDKGAALAAFHEEEAALLASSDLDGYDRERDEGTHLTQGEQWAEEGLYR